MFWEQVFPKDQEGFVSFALKTPSSFKQKYYRWPDDVDKISTIGRLKDKGDLFFCPSLLALADLRKSNVLCSSVLWADLDGGTPTNAQVTGLPTASVLPSPAVVVNSGTVGHEHRYWPLNQTLGPSEIEAKNHALRHILGADASGIDCTQYLRVPGTLNHKTKPPREVEIVDECDLRYNPTLFPSYSIEQLDALYTEVDLIEILLSRQCNDKVKALLTQSPEKVQDRSEALMHFAHVCREAGLSEDQVFTLLRDADLRWGKFSRRDDRDLRLSQIVERAFSNISKLQRVEAEPGNRVDFSWKEIGSSTNTIQWLIENLLRPRGLLYFVSSTGVGKSTAALNLGVDLVLGKEDFLGFKIESTEQQTVMYGSHEMDEQEVNYFVSHMNALLPEPALDRLHEHFKFVATGRPVYLNTAEGQQFYEERFKRVRPTGFILDTLGASHTGSSSDEASIKPLLDWIDYIRQEYGMWVLINHHYRKATPGANRQDRNIDDMFGNQAISARANSALGFYNTKTANIIGVHSLKGRFRTGEQNAQTIYVRRLDNLWLERDDSFRPSNNSSKTSQSLNPLVQDVLDFAEIEKQNINFKNAERGGFEL